MAETSVERNIRSEMLLWGQPPSAVQSSEARLTFFLNSGNLSRYEESARVDYPSDVGENECSISLDADVSDFSALQSWVCGAAGSALPWHGRGRRFDPDQVHHISHNLDGSNAGGNGIYVVGLCGKP